MLVKIIPHDLDDAAAEHQRSLHGGPAEVEIPVFQPYVFPGHCGLRRIEGRRLGTVQHSQRLRADLNVAGRQLGVMLALGAAFHDAHDLDHVLAAELAGRIQQVAPFVEDDLRDTVAIAQIDKYAAAMVALAVHPPAERHLLIHMLGAQLAAGVRP
jgi:hypothetical protein